MLRPKRLGEVERVHGNLGKRRKLQRVAVGLFAQALRDVEKIGFVVVKADYGNNEKREDPKARRQTRPRSKGTEKNIFGGMQIVIHGQQLVL